MRNPHRPSRTATARLDAELLACLTPKERDALRLRRAGMTDREIAAALGVSRAAVAMRFCRARRRLAPWPRLWALLAPRRGPRHG